MWTIIVSVILSRKILGLEKETTLDIQVTFANTRWGFNLWILLKEHSVTL